MLDWLATWQYNECLRWDVSLTTPDHGWAKCWVKVDPHFDPQMINYPKLAFRGDQNGIKCNFKGFKTVSKPV